MVEATTGGLEAYLVSLAVLGVGKQVLWQHGTPERTESYNGTHFRNHLIRDTWAKEHGTEWLYHVSCWEELLGRSSVTVVC